MACALQKHNAHRRRSAVGVRTSGLHSEGERLGLLSSRGTTAATSTTTASTAAAATTTTAAAAASATTATAEAGSNRIPGRVSVNNLLGVRIGVADQGFQDTIGLCEIGWSKCRGGLEASATATAAAAEATTAARSHRRGGRRRRGRGVLSERHRNRSGQRTGREQHFQ
jgi:hypothetical protein